MRTLPALLLAVAAATAASLVVTMPAPTASLTACVEDHCETIDDGREKDTHVGVGSGNGTGHFEDNETSDPGDGDEGNETGDPGNETGDPGNETGDPGNETGDPGNETEDPGTEDPGNETEDPGTEDPGNETGPPGNETGDPGDGTDPDDDTGGPPAGDGDGDGGSSADGSADGRGQGGASIATTSDRDSDGIQDDADNCPDDQNRDQVDTDGDGIGDACTEDTTPGTGVNGTAATHGSADGDQGPDRDEDGIRDDADNCPDTKNRDQADRDEDGVGDACDDPPAAVEAGGDAEAGTGVGTEAGACMGCDEDGFHDVDGPERCAACLHGGMPVPADGGWPAPLLFLVGLVGAGAPAGYMARRVIAIRP